MQQKNDINPSKYPPAPLEISYPAADGGYHTRRFDGPVRIGRDRECEVRIAHVQVSRRHLECVPRADGWWWRDLNSRNGTFRAGRRLREGSLRERTTLVLGPSGPAITLMPRPASAPTHKRWPQRVALVLVVLLLFAAAGFGAYQYYTVRRLSALAIDMFYTMKTLELNVVNLQSALYETLESARARYQSEIETQQRQLASLQQRYAEFVARVNDARLWLDDEDRLILRVARLFGECDVNAPPEFVAEVKRYIRKWQSSDRLASAIRRLERNDYTPVIALTLQAQSLPPQFLYLALQESNFRTEAVGPPTRYGNAKGMWQFIPATASRYGLELGPLADQSVYDPADERHDFAKSTLAAARYLRDIYRTEAQASGLLVMASYNWGEGNIVARIEQLPENPRERNFWALLQEHRIPQETYDYVFYIVAAAVIGENPSLFGFDFANPLADYEDSALTAD